MARPFAARIAAAPEVALIDDAVEGRAPLPMEETAGDADGAEPVRLESSPFALVTQSRRRRELTVEAVASTWDLTVLAVEGPAGGRRYLSVPLGAEPAAG